MDEAQLTSEVPPVNANFPLSSTFQRFLSQMSSHLTEDFGYSKAEAEAMVSKYLELFTDPQYCDQIGIPLQDEEFFFHESPQTMATRVHYYLGLKGDPDPDKYFEWRRDYYKQKNSR